MTATVETRGASSAELGETTGTGTPAGGSDAGALSAAGAACGRRHSAEEAWHGGNQAGRNQSVDFEEPGSGDWEGFAGSSGPTSAAAGRCGRGDPCGGPPTTLISRTPDGAGTWKSHAGATCTTGKRTAESFGASVAEDSTTEGSLNCPSRSGRNCGAAISSTFASGKAAGSAGGTTAVIRSSVFICATGRASSGLCWRGGSRRPRRRPSARPCRTRPGAPSSSCP